MQLNKINCMETPKIDEYLLCKSINIKSYSKKRVLYHITILIYEIYKNDEIAIKMIKKRRMKKLISQIVHGFWLVIWIECFSFSTSPRIHCC